MFSSDCCGLTIALTGVTNITADFLGRQNQQRWLLRWPRHFTVTVIADVTTAAPCANTVALTIVLVATVCAC